MPVSNKNQQMTAFMVARSDPGHYGELTTYVMPNDRQPPSPQLVASTMSSDPTVSQLQTLLGVTGGGSKLVFGNLLIVPIEQSVMYVRPVYVQASGDNTPPLLREVVVEYNNQVHVAETLPAALKKFGQFTDYPAPSSTTPAPSQNPSGPAPTLTAADLLARAAQDFADADAALKNGDLATYQTKIRDAQQNVAQAQQLLGGTAPGSTTTTTAPSSSSGGESTTTTTTAPASTTSTTSGASA